MVRFVLFLVALLLAWPSQAHDKWANGTPVPSWIKSKCCASDEAVDLTERFGVTAADIVTHPQQITQGGEHGSPHSTIEITIYHIRGFIPDTAQYGVYPSQDGHVWVFSDKKEDPKSSLHFWCMFLPCAPRNEAAPNDFGGQCS